MLLCTLNIVIRSFISQSAFNQICSILRLFLIEYDRRGCPLCLPHSGGLHGRSQGHCGVVLGWFGVCVHMLAAFPKEIRRIHVLYVCKSEDVIRKA